MPSSKQANNPAFLQQMMQAPSQAMSQQPTYDTSAPAMVNITQFLTNPTGGWYGRTMSGV